MPGYEDGVGEDPGAGFGVGEEAECLREVIVRKERVWSRAGCVRCVDGEIGSCEVLKP